MSVFGEGVGERSHPHSAPVATAGTIDSRDLVFGSEEGRQGHQLAGNRNPLVLEGAFIMSVFK